MSDYSYGGYTRGYTPDMGSSSHTEGWLNIVDQNPQADVNEAASPPEEYIAELATTTNHTPIVTSSFRINIAIKALSYLAPDYLSVLEANHYQSIELHRSSNCISMSVHATSLLLGKEDWCKAGYEVVEFIEALYGNPSQDGDTQLFHAKLAGAHGYIRRWASGWKEEFNCDKAILLDGKEVIVLKRK